MDFSWIQIGQFTWYYIFAGDLSPPYTLTSKELPSTPHSQPALYQYPQLYFNTPWMAMCQELQNLGTPSDFRPDTKLNISQCGKIDFHYCIIPPYLTSRGLILLGELDKIVPVSEARFSGISITADDVMVNFKSNWSTNQKGSSNSLWYVYK